DWRVSKENMNVSYKSMKLEYSNACNNTNKILNTGFPLYISSPLIPAIQRFLSSHCPSSIPLFIMASYIPSCHVLLLLPLFFLPTTLTQFISSVSSLYPINKSSHTHHLILYREATIKWVVMTTSEISSSSRGALYHNDEDETDIRTKNSTRTAIRANY
ncbi:hypothetical protein L9F63_022731, partial [Diploptera punctata]